MVRFGDRHRLRSGLAMVVALGAMAVGCSGGTDDDPTAFCNALRAATTTTGAVEQLDLDEPESLDAARLELTTLVDAAPSDLRDDVAVVAEVYGAILDSVASTAPSARGDILRNLQPRLDEAAEPAARLQRFGESECSLVFDAPPQPSPTPTPLQIDD